MLRICRSKTVQKGWKAESDLGGLGAPDSIQGFQARFPAIVGGKPQTLRLDSEIRRTWFHMFS